MKKYVLFLILFLTLVSLAKAEEITLFDKNGDAIAYIADDDDMTIYLWEGSPVAFLVKSGDAKNPKTDNFSIYGFNGKHLGWISEGIIRDHDGYTVGFIEGSINIRTSREPRKGRQERTPRQSRQEREPREPRFSNNWSETPLKYFLKEGRE